MLDNYNRNIEFFKNQSKNIKTIRTVDLYDEFNNLGNYFNNELVVELEQALNTSLNVTPNKFLANVGNGTIKWVNILDIIDNYSINLNKLKNIQPKSILCTNNNGEIFPLVGKNYTILFARYNNIHIWRKLTNDDIENNTIDSININKLSELNLTDNLANDFVSDNTIDSVNIDDNAIDISKTAYNTLSLDRIAIQSEINSGLIPDKYNVGGSKDGVASFDAFVNRCLSPSKILDNSIDINIHPNLFQSRYYSDNPLYLFEREKNEFEENSYDTNNYEVLEYFNIVPETIDDDFLDTYEDIGSIDNLPWFNDGRNPQEPRYFQKGYIHPTPTCRVEGRLIPLRGLRLRHFDDEVRAALIAKGVTDND